MEEDKERRLALRLSKQRTQVFIDMFDPKKEHSTNKALKGTYE